ncbi:MAG: GNAT family N-acetyltransferase [Pseudodesulfovibrio sp.]|nr:GNAT family N-acetyltransferase [Pseudodesulfovibrio sp.]
MSSVKIELKFTIKDVDWKEAAIIFKRAPLGTREPEKIERTFKNSNLVCFAWDNETLVGFARALSDGEQQSVIYDLCILPEYQSRHLGKRIMTEMIERLDTPTTVLWSVPGKEGFYERFGFKPMLTAMARFEDPEASASQGYIKL